LCSVFSPPTEHSVFASILLLASRRRTKREEKKKEREEKRKTTADSTFPSSAVVFWKKEKRGNGDLVHFHHLLQDPFSPHLSCGKRETVNVVHLCRKPCVLPFLTRKVGEGEEGGGGTVSIPATPTRFIFHFVRGERWKKGGEGKDEKRPKKNPPISYISYQDKRERGGK